MSTKIKVALGGVASVLGLVVGAVCYGADASSTFTQLEGNVDLLANLWQSFLTMITAHWLPVFIAIIVIVAALGFVVRHIYKLFNH